MEKKRLKKPVAELRVDLLADPSMKNMAKKLGMTLEAYVEKVLDYAQHPDKQPMLHIAPDAEVKAQGGHTVEDVKAWFQDILDGKISIAGATVPHDEFQAAQKKKGNL